MALGESAAKMKVRYGEKRRPAGQRYLPFAAKAKTGSISPKQSLTVPVQFRDLFIAKSRKLTFTGDNQFLTVGGNSVSIAVLPFAG